MKPLLIFLVLILFGAGCGNKVEEPKEPRIKILYSFPMVTPSGEKEFKYRYEGSDYLISVKATSTNEEIITAIESDVKERDAYWLKISEQRRLEFKQINELNELLK